MLSSNVPRAGTCTTRWGHMDIHKVRIIQHLKKKGHMIRQGEIKLDSWTPHFASNFMVDAKAFVQPIATYDSCQPSCA